MEEMDLHTISYEVGTMYLHDHVLLKGFQDKLSLAGPVCFPEYIEMFWNTNNVNFCLQTSQDEQRISIEQHFL